MPSIIDIKMFLHWDIWLTKLQYFEEKGISFFYFLMQISAEVLEWLWINSFEFLLDFAFYYPLFMAYLWTTGALIYYFRWEKRKDLK